MRRIALLILTLFPLLSQSTWAQPFVEIMSTSGGMYACEGMEVDFVALPLFEGQGRWMVSNAEVMQVDGERVTIQSVKSGTKLQLTYELQFKNGSMRDTILTIDVRPTTYIVVEQQDNRLVPVKRRGEQILSSYQWKVDGKPSSEFRNAPFENPQNGSKYSLIILSQEACYSVVGIGLRKK